MYAVLIEDHDGKAFRIYETYDEALNAQNNLSCMGIGEVTVFEYDSESKQFIELYTV